MLGTTHVWQLMKLGLPLSLCLSLLQVSQKYLADVSLRHQKQLFAIFKWSILLALILKEKRMLKIASPGHAGHFHIILQIRLSYN